MTYRDPWVEKRPALEEDSLPGEPLCGCDGIPCRINATDEDGVQTCGACELPCHSVEVAD